MNTSDSILPPGSGMSSQLHVYMSFPQHCSPSLEKIVEANALQKVNIYSRVRDAIFLLSIFLDLKQVYYMCMFFPLAQMSVFSLLTQKIKN